MARDDIATDEFLRDQFDRSQRHHSRRRRSDRFRRKRVYASVVLVFLGLLVLGGPSLVSHSSLGRSLLSVAAARHGISLDAESVRTGWITPLRITGVRVHSRSDGNYVRIEQIDSGITVTDLIKGLESDFGEIAVRGVDVHCTVNSGYFSLEEDFAELLHPTDPSGERPRGTVSVQDIAIKITDMQTGSAWHVEQTNADIQLRSEAIDVRLEGVLNEPGGNAGSIQTTISLDDNASERWILQLDCETLPLSVVSLLRRRFPQTSSTIPLTISGNTTGSMRLTGIRDRTITASFDPMRVRHFRASDPATGDWAWSNQTATISGGLTVTPDRLIGHQLVASTDFASAELDGSFSRSITLTGANDNPVQWLDAINGSASANVDLAALDAAMPGVLPLRHRARILSGIATASIESLPNDGTRRSRLSLRTDPVRASAAGRAVVIEPIELAAVVLRSEDHLSAEEFRWQSSFASVIGQGDLRSGSADVEIDFGRLASMLRPIIEISKTDLDGLAKGNIHWDANGDRLWRLSGTGNASNVQVTLPGGKTIRQPHLQGNIQAMGRWGNARLDELSSATMKLVGSGLDVRAEMMEPVRDPSPDTAIPLRIESQGRLQSFADTIGPWLPEQVHDVDGGFKANLRGEVSSSAARLTSATVELDEPRLAYGNRFFAQPNVKIHFDGALSWPATELNVDSFTMVGDALSAGVRGRVGGKAANLEVAWRAKLHRLQGSVRKRVARQSTGNIRSVAFQRQGGIETDQWLVMGDFQGTVLLKRHAKTIEMETKTTGHDVALVQPPRASAAANIVGPMPADPRFSQSTPSRSSNPNHENRSRVVWSEPNLKVDGMLRFDLASGRVEAESMQVAADWFATTLSGDATIEPTFRTARLSGPARLKMDQVANRLSKLAGTTIRADGIHQTPLEIAVVRDGDGALAFTVDGKLGWESGEFAGVRFGESIVPFRLTETSVSVSPSVIPVGRGHLNLAGDVHYRPGPLWIRIEPGVVAQSVRLTPEMTDRWLKYVAPIAANATRIDGTISAEIDEAMIVIDDPSSSRASGSLTVDGVRMTAGPLTQQIISGVKQLKSLSRSIPGAQDGVDVAGQEATELITMPPQSVEFLVDRGVVSHQRMYFDIDRAQLVTSGQVSLDGRLGIDAQVPLDERWLGKDLRGLAGQGVSLPISGTLSEPRLDASGVRQVVAQLATQTIQSAGETFLQKHLQRSEDYIGDQIGRGLDKLFGR